MDINKEMIAALLTLLPKDYPKPFVTHNEEGYMLIINATVIFQGVDTYEALRRAADYVRERERNPDLPVGVMNGIYD